MFCHPELYKHCCSRRPPFDYFRSMQPRRLVEYTGPQVQSEVDATNHLIVGHEVTNVGTDRSQLATMAQAAKAALRSDNLDVVADRGYFKGEEISANRPGSPSRYPSRKPRAPSRQAALANLILFIWPRTMSIAARLARSWRTTSPLMKMARKCGFT